ncbi:MAG: NADH-quinone oxidoreductase subunit NuoE [Mycolicibacterium sp.]|uniref:NADH-quinone oxidoreductase subunit NuoE n=1 Tax=Mycolicibacterium sp. TaxID=2320850 RepID=UPI003D09812C
MSIFLELGQRPDEAGPPIQGPAAYSAEVEARLAADAAMVIARYPNSRSALLPLLHLTQSEDGYLTPAGISFCASQLGLSPAEVTAVATFYSMYRRTPTGEYLVGVCTNTLCAIMGGDAILDSLQEHLGVDAGDTTADGRITLEHIECNAACDYAPVVMVNWEFFDNQTPSSARDLVDALRDGEPPRPSRSPAVCTFRETARTLAGLSNTAGSDDDSPVGAATLAGLRTARELGMRAPQSATPLPSGPPVPKVASRETDS